jgi:hypothetical protein
MHGQLPFDTRGMEDPVPTIDFSPTGSLDSPYSLERADLDGKQRCILSKICANTFQIWSMFWTT